MVPSYEIGLLGRFVVRVDGQPVPDGAWRHKRAAELVKILALTGRIACTANRSWICSGADLAPDAAAGNLRKAVHFARAALGAAAAISRSGEMLELCPHGQIWVDALAFEAAAAQARSARSMSTRASCCPRTVTHHGRRSHGNGCVRCT